MSKSILGLDLGTNSIGWALLGTAPDGSPTHLIKCGVRIFQEAVDAKTRTPKNKARRDARSLRRTLARRRRRIAKLKGILFRHGFIPKELATATNPEAALNAIGDPYELRCRALDTPLSLVEFGRVLLHLCKRRGFLSNRKTLVTELADDPRFTTLLAQVDDAKSSRDSDSEEAKDEGEIKEEIKGLKRHIRESGARTLGEFLARQRSEVVDGHTRRIHTDRAMYREEFDLVWNSQERFHESLRDVVLRAEIHSAIFFQRPLRSQRHLVGRCTLERDRQRAAKASPEAQRVRILQDLNNVEILNRVTGELRPLSSDERELLLRELDGGKVRKLPWSKVKKLLGIHKGETINLEEGGKDELPGNTTYWWMNKALGDTWEALPPVERRRVIEDILTIDKPAALAERLMRVYGFSPEQTLDLLTAGFEPGYASHSLKALRRILPFLEQGAKYHKAFEAAGYLRPDQIKRTFVDRLPSPPEVRNPVVQRALFETRKVVNAVVRKFGKPEIIRVELAKDLKQTKKDREREQKQNKENERANNEAREQAGIAGVSRPSNDDLLKYRLWKEAGQCCPYTGRSIGIAQLFSGDVDIDHILPYSRTLDDSYLNKTICLAAENRLVKRNQTPYEAYGADTGRYEQIVQCSKNMPLGKQRRFQQRELDGIDDFVARQLNDTRYASVAARDFLAILGCNMQVAKGAVTALLRTKWDLNRVLSIDGSGKKNRADHRHHAIDALVIALSSPSILKAVSISAARPVGMGPWDKGFHINPPWHGLKDEVSACIATVIVSHAPTRKISGALHEETAYGRRGDGTYAYRKLLTALSGKSEVEKIRDPAIRRLVLERVGDVSDREMKKILGAPLMQNPEKGIPIRRVRLAVTFSDEAVLPVVGNDGSPYKYFKLGNNHHVAIFEEERTGKRRGVFVRAIEAAQRARRERSPVVATSADAGWRFVASISANDMVRIDEGGKSRVYRLQWLGATNNRLIFREHTAATLDDDNTLLRISVGKFRGTKIEVDVLGEVNPAIQT